MSLENTPVKRPPDEEIPRLTKKQLLEAVENQQVSYVTPYDERYPELVVSKYSNFVHHQCQECPETLRDNLAWAFNTLLAEGFFHRDWVRVKGRSFPTYVSRVLIGKPGVTYKYLGLRLFALPWSFPGRDPENDVEEACCIIGELNAHFRETSRGLITEKRVASDASSKSECATNGESNTLNCDRKVGETSNNSVQNSKDKDGVDAETEQESAITTDNSVASENNVSVCGANSTNNEHSKPSSQMTKTENEGAVVSSSSAETERDSNVSDGEVQSKSVPIPKETGHNECAAEQNSSEAETVSEHYEDAAKNKKLWKSSSALPEGASQSNANLRTLPSRRISQSRNSLPQDYAEHPTLSLEEGTEFNVALLNYMDPNDQTLRLKEEPYYGLGELAVSWHMDTGLVKGSTVAVYSHTETENCERDDCHRWCVGVKVQWDVDTPALAVSMDSGDSYYMLSDLNDTHQHCVVVGSHPRFSSTHRVAECSTGTLSYIQSRCNEAVDNLEMGEGDVSPKLKSTSIDVISLSEDTHTEVEFEWLRQFWMQGNTRANERDFWLEPMEELEQKWLQMELMTKLAVDAAMEVSDGDHHVLCEKLVDYLSRRNRLRQEHINRYGGKALVSMPSDEMPSYRPYWQAADAHHPLPFDLDDIIHRLICHIDAGQA